jgi:hypothetical protein
MATSAATTLRILTILPRLVSAPTLPAHSMSDRPVKKPLTTLHELAGGGAKLEDSLSDYTTSQSKFFSLSIA